MSRRLAIALLAAACSRPPPRAPDAPPDLLLVVLPNDAPVEPPAGLRDRALVFPNTFASHTAPAPAWRALLTGQWPGSTEHARPNTLHGVLHLYGYRTLGATPPALTAAASTLPWLTSGLEPLAGTCIADQLRTLASEGPGTEQVALYALVAADPAASCPVGKELNALAHHLSGPRAAYTQAIAVGLTGPIPDAPLSEHTAPTPLWIFGSPSGAGPRFSMANTIDVLSTLLPQANAVVPTDAPGANLHMVASGNTEDAAPAAFQQDSTGALSIRTRGHRLYVPPGPRPLPEQRPEDTVLDTLPEAKSSLDPAGTLYTTLRAWDTQRRATSAEDRMGNEAFRTMLRDQGYWH